MTIKAKVDELLDQIQLPRERVNGILVISVQDNAVIYSKDVDKPEDKASMCLSLLSCSTLMAQSFNDSAIKLIRSRTESTEYFLVCGKYKADKTVS
jgi:hypothetical protein